MAVLSLQLLWLNLARRRVPSIGQCIAVALFSACCDEANKVAEGPKQQL
jgi:hypothetical protein